MSVVSYFRREPAVVTAVLGTGAAVGASFGVHLTPDQLKALFSAVGLVVSAVIRSRVTPIKVAPQPSITPTVVQGSVVGHAGLPPA